MTSFYTIINDEFKVSLAEKVHTASVETIRTMFGYDLEVSDTDQEIDNQHIAVRVAMSQGVESIVIRMIYNRNFIMQLVGGCYIKGPCTPSDDEMCEDAACELANIIGNKIKSHLNE